MLHAARKEAPDGGCQGFFHSFKKEVRHDDGGDHHHSPNYHLTPIQGTGMTI